MSPVALVVDDSMLIRHTVCRYLEQRGYSVESATNGIEALEILKTVLPDLIITDLLMPKMDGHELIAKLKAMPHTADIPIVVLAARGGPEVKEKSVAHIIYKDISIDAQLQKVLFSVMGASAIEE